MAGNGLWYFYAMLIEMGLFTAILVFQYHHMKTSMDNRLML